MTERIADLRHTAPPSDWGVEVDLRAIERLAQEWAPTAFERPAFDYPGTPQQRDESWWFDYAVLSVSVLACLWPPEGDAVWLVERHGEWLDDAPGIFAAFTRTMAPSGFDVDWFRTLTAQDGSELFTGRGTLQLVPERTERLRSVAQALHDRWSGSALQLVNEADRNGQEIVRLLVETVPGFCDRPTSSHGVLHFDKLAHLCAAIMAAGVGWENARFHGFDTFPVYPDYMLPRVFRHYGAMVYRQDIADAIDARRVIDADSTAEHAIRWATIYCGQQLTDALETRGQMVSGPALDYRLWSIAVLGPDAASFGEHHRTITMAY